MRLAILLAILASMLPAEAFPIQAYPGDPPAERADSENPHEAIARWLAASGLSRQEVRDGLQQGGHDAMLLDRYYAFLEQGTALPEGPVPAAVQIYLRSLGYREGLPVLHDREPPLSAPDSLESVLPTFGADLFSRHGTEFDVPLSGPVDRDYRLGPGDEVVLVLTGDVETYQSAEITREGGIVLPQAGRISLAGRTIEEAESTVLAALSPYFSGLGRGGGSRINLQLSLGALRSNLVYVIGEVSVPGSYAVSSVASVLSALYLAGGPREHGSYREVLVRRGSEVVHRVDLYEYLLRGDPLGMFRLEHGDVVFVPIAGPQVSVQGAVRRPALFEMKEGESLADVLGFAGGTSSAAAAGRIQIDRILPPEQRLPGVDRVLLDADLSALRSGERFGVLDGDRVIVFDALTERRNRVTLTGAVHQAGEYEWRQEMSLADLLTRAGGLAEMAYSERIHVHRLDPETGLRTLIRANRNSPGVILADRDSVVVFSLAEMINTRTVEVGGLVKNPGVYPLSGGMSVQDLILAAGGLSRGAYIHAAELARTSDDGLDAVAVLSSVPLFESYEETSDGQIRWLAADESPLQHGDFVSVRRDPGYQPLRTVTLHGEVLYPGVYALRTQNDRISDVIQRAGGMTEWANLQGAQLTRGNHMVGTDFNLALQREGGVYDLLLEAGDSLVVPRLDPTVLVTGAVAFDTRVRAMPGKPLSYYIAQAGGYLEGADRARVSVLYQNGERNVVRSRWFIIPDSNPNVLPGTTIHVPLRPAREMEGVDWDRVAATGAGILGSVATVFLVLERLTGEH